MIGNESLAEITLSTPNSIACFRSHQNSKYLLTTTYLYLEYIALKRNAEV